MLSYVILCYVILPYLTRWANQISMWIHVSDAERGKMFASKSRSTSSLGFTTDWMKSGARFVTNHVTWWYKTNRPRLIYQYFNMAPRLSGQNCKFLSFFCPSILKGDLDTKKTTPNIKVCPGSLGAMLEYWYIGLGYYFSTLKWKPLYQPIREHNYWSAVHCQIAALTSFVTAWSTDEPALLPSRNGSTYSSFITVTQSSALLFCRLAVVCSVSSFWNIPYCANRHGTHATHFWVVTLSLFSTVLGLVYTTPEKFANGVFTLKTRQLFSVHTRPEKFENGVFTLKTHKMFSVHTTLKEFEKGIITGHFGFVFGENSGWKITWLS